MGMRPGYLRSSFDRKTLLEIFIIAAEASLNSCQRVFGGKNSLPQVFSHLPEKYFRISGSSGSTTYLKSDSHSIRTLIRPGWVRSTILNPIECVGRYS